MMLSTGHGIGIPDRVLGPFVHPERTEQARIVAETIHLGLDDRVAWSLIVGAAGELAAYRTIYGPRRTPRRKRKR